MSELPKKLKQSDKYPVHLIGNNVRNRVYCYVGQCWSEEVAAEIARRYNGYSALSQSHKELVKKVTTICRLSANPLTTKEIPEQKTQQLKLIRVIDAIYELSQEALSAAEKVKESPNDQNP